MPELDQEEQELLESYENDEWRSIQGREPEIEQYREYARATFKKDMRVNIRMSSQDLDGLNKRALAEGIPARSPRSRMGSRKEHHYRVSMDGRKKGAPS